MENSAPINRGRGAESQLVKLHKKNDLRGDCPSEEPFLVSDNSRSAVSSQSTGLAGRYRLLGAGEPHPTARSKS